MVQRAMPKAASIFICGQFVDPLYEAHIAGQPVGPNVPLGGLHLPVSHERLDRNLSGNTRRMFA
jgi:hypothetical protein